MIWLPVMGSSSSVTMTHISKTTVKAIIRFHSDLLLSVCANSPSQASPRLMFIPHDQHPKIEFIQCIVHMNEFYSQVVMLLFIKTLHNHVKNGKLWMHTICPPWAFVCCCIMKKKSQKFLQGRWSRYGWFGKKLCILIFKGIN